MKDEAKGKIISEFVRLNSNIYFLVVMGSEEIKKAKGVNKNVVEKTRHKEYVDVLLNKKIIRHKMKRIQNKLHIIGICDVYKISLMIVLIVYLIFIRI